MQSLLSNPVLSNMEGVKDIILTYLYKNATQVKPGVNPTLYIILQILAETPEKAVNLVLAKQPTTIMLFAKVSDYSLVKLLINKYYVAS